MFYFLKLNSNPYHYKLKFPSTSKQKFNSKFQEFETVRILKKKWPNLDQKTLTKSKNHEKNQQKRRNKKKGNLPFFLISSLLFCWFFSLLFDLGNVFWSKFGRFFWGFERFRILGILNCFIFIEQINKQFFRTKNRLLFYLIL